MDYYLRNLFYGRTRIFVLDFPVALLFLSSAFLFASNVKLGISLLLASVVFTFVKNKIEASLEYKEIEFDYNDKFDCVIGTEEGFEKEFTRNHGPLIERINTQERIIGVANIVPLLDKNGEEFTEVIIAILQPGRHGHIFQLASQIYGKKAEQEFKRTGHHEQGFLTSWGRFVDREMGLIIAEAAEQLIRKTGNIDSTELFSEDVWDIPDEYLNAHDLAYRKSLPPEQQK